jgi:choline-sulfatase
VKPIVLFFPDQLRADALGIGTPNLSRLAAESVRFDCITNAPLCRPARITMMTGLPVAAHGFDTNRRVPRPGSLPSHVAAVRDAGYRTIVVGKTHLHDGRGHFDRHRDVLEAWGFAESVELPDPQQHWVRSAHADWLSATTPKGAIDKYDRWRDYVVNHTLGAPPDGPPWHLSTDDHLDMFCAGAAAAEIRACADPFYLQVNFPGPHPPFDPTTEFLEAVDPRAFPPLRPPTEGPATPIALRYQRYHGSENLDLDRLRAAYFGKVALVDRAIGLVLDAMERLMDEAWILVTSDHGELLGDHGFTGKVLAYEPAIRVPLLIRPPGGIAGWTDRGSVDHLDVIATIAAIAGAEFIGPGTSLADRVLRGPSAPAAHEHKTVVFENMGYVGVRTRGAKLTFDRRMGRPVELYDRIRDPSESWNVVDEPEHRALRDELVEGLSIFS